MTTPVFWTFLSLAAASWVAVLGRWLFKRSGLSERLAIRRWLRQDHQRQR
jgi:hypothetical protein